MPLATGTRLGAYEITGRLGSGGMGEVYRATDTKLGREVAIKTLPSALAKDPDRLARFDREAKLLAALNHAHIGSVYSLDEHEGTWFLAMELVEGETLEEKLKGGALPIEDALRLALQIAEALEATHGKGVVHRDLKPANVMVTADGVVKVLDFGLAKAFSGDPNEASPVHSPALSLAMTQQGFVLGTAGYMSPEQASGQATDQRADIWAFGVLLYEMLTGLPVFTGESVPHILADVLKSEPDWTRLPKDLHPRLRLMLERCLKKNVRSRYHSMADVRVDIEEVLNDPDGAATQTEPPPAAMMSMLPRLAAAAVVTAVIVGLLAWTLWPTSAQRPVVRFTYAIPEGQPLQNAGVPTFALSPDGRRFVYRTRQGFYLRSLDELEARLIPGTEEETAHPFFSPDGQSIGYFVPGPESIERIAITGGAPVVIADFFGIPLGASWESDGAILFGQPQGIYRVPATGGTPELLIPAENEGLYGPSLLPDGDSVLFSAGTPGRFDSGRIVVQSLSTGERTTLVDPGYDARYVPTGHIVYVRDDGLFGMAFDPQTLTVSGGAVPLVQGVMRAGASGGANYGISRDGTLAYVAGPSSQRPRTTLVWVDREGREEAINVPPRVYVYANLSPDGTQIVLDVRDEEDDIWVWDLERETLQRLTFDAGFNRGTAWSPDGRRVAFSREIEGTEEIYWQAADGSGVPERLTEESPGPMLPLEFTPDGAALLYQPMESDEDIWIVPVEGPATDGMPLLATAAREMSATVSPSGRWLAYESDESGRWEVYVRPFPAVDTGRWQISTAGGTRPRWSRDGQELFYYVEGGSVGERTGTIMAVAVDTEAGFRPGAPRMLFQGPYVSPAQGPDVFDVAPDGQRFLLIKVAEESAAPEQPEVVVVVNWFEELKRLVPTE